NNNNAKLCLIVFAISNSNENERLFAPFSALLKTLAMEETSVNFKAIHTDIIDKQILYEIWDENFINEIICYSGGNRFVERMQEMNDKELIVEQIRNTDRILITGNIRGIAGKLIEILKPRLAIAISRTMLNTCSSDKNGSIIRTIQADCTDYMQMEKIFATFAPFDMIFHCAATVSNCLMENMNVKLFEMVCQPKVLGLQNIIKLSRLYSIQKIVAFSSAATILGSAGQANYVVANELMEYLMRKNVPNGLVISWGPWDGQGFLAGEHMAKIRRQIQTSGWKLLQVEQVTQLCYKLLSSKGHHIAMISGITDVKSDIGFMSMGIDSLMITEMQKLLNERLNLNIPIAIFYEYSTVQTLSQYLAQNMLINDNKLQNDKGMKNDKNDKIAIIGYSGAFSGASNDEIFWRSLLDGQELIEQQKRTKINDHEEMIEGIGIMPDLDKFDYQFWNLTSSDANYIDPQIRKFVEHAYIALERSGLIRIRDKLRIGVIVGAEPSEYHVKSRCIGGIENLYEINQKDFIATWTSHLLNLNGPSFAVYSACSTALVAIVQAINLLKQNQCDIVLAGAVSLALPYTGNNSNNNNSLKHGMILSTDGHCRPFDQQSSGTVRGSAVGVIVLQRLNDAQKMNIPVIGNIIGYAITNDGLLKSSFMAPNITGQQSCIKKAIEMCDTNEIDYIECHGSGTITGDLIELTAMSQCYQRDTLIGSVKANIGHALAGAGIAAIIKLCKIAEMRIIPRQINFEQFNEHLNDVSFQITKCNIEIEKKILRLAVNASGIGGTNAHLIIENDNNHFLSTYQSNNNHYFYALIITGKSKNACMQLCNCIGNYLQMKMNLNQIASTLQNYREHFQYRFGITVRTISDAKNELKNVVKIEKIINLKCENIAFYIAPQGLEYLNMGFEAMKYNQTFCNQPYSQLATFIICYALMEQLKEWKIDGCIMIGHSLGEYVAAVQANVFDIETALMIIFKRGCLIAKTENAKMLAVNCAIYNKHLNSTKKCLQIPETIEISAHLHSNLKCFVGKPKTIDEFKQLLEINEIHCRELTTNYGFHSSFMNSILDEFEQFLAKFTFQKPTKQILSNINGELIKHFDAKYMIEHMRYAVRLDKCIANLSDQIKVIIEIGPKGILESLLNANKQCKIDIISTIPSKKQYEKGNLLHIATKLWMKGYELNWEKICGNYSFDKFLPNYQFEKNICWEKQTVKWTSENIDVNFNNFYYDTIIHAWNFPVNLQTDESSDSYLLTSFYSVYWILTIITQNMIDLKFLTCIDWNAEPEIFTVLGPIREFVMTKRSMKAACILCTSEINLFDALQLLQLHHANFALIRNFVNGKFEYFSYQLKLTECDNYLIGNEKQSIIDKNDCCLIQNADIIVIFGFGSIGQSFANVLCQNFNNLTICIACPNATKHFQQHQNKINQWKILRNLEMSKKVNQTNVAAIVDVSNEQHKFFAYDIDVTNNDDVRHLLTQIIMNALFGIPGNSDYAASNIFLDICSEQKFRNVQKITTVQWTGWKDSTMLSNYNSDKNKSQNPVANLIMKYSLSVNDAEQMIKKCLYQQGLIAVSFINPNEIIQEIRKLNFTLNDKFATELMEEKNMKMNCNEFKNILAKIWMNYLNVEQITDHDDFFQLGGHSLNGMQIIWEINCMLQIDCKLDDLFQHSQFQQFLHFLQNAKLKRNEQKFSFKLKDYKMFDCIEKLKMIRLSYPQENMFILRELHHPTLYNICFLLTFQGLICIKSLHKAFLFLIARQTSLRTTFLIRNDTCYQEIQSLTESYYHMLWPMLNEYERYQLINDEKNHIMDLRQIPFRLLSMCSSESSDKMKNEYMIVISQHHIIT
ncbi:unnamed protein product, partial [Brugia timori]|uniref:Fatty acid synthase n=1 Tax=Brugia timori TaxID=42155 RepID=A0A0R3QXI0_9BILA